MKTCKRILGLFICLTVFMLGITNVYAEDECQRTIDNQDWVARYDADINYADKTFKVSIGNGVASDLKKIIKNIKFKVTKIAYYKETADPNKEDTVLNSYSEEITDTNTINSLITNSTKTVTAGNSISITKSKFGEDSLGFEITLEPVDFKDPLIADKCGNKNFKLILAIYLYADGNKTEPIGTVDPGDQSSYISGFKCPSTLDELNAKSQTDSEYNKDGFNYKFCYAKLRAIKEGNVYDFGNNGDKLLTYEEKFGSPLKFSCDYKTPVAPGGDEYYLDVNRKYLYGHQTFTKTAGEYVYNYTNSSKRKTEAAQCKVTCEESVVVEYGPPVASKAGLCFEYKVKVTSRVNCNSEAAPNPPTPQTLCTPTPVCKHGKAEYRQGGPNDAFDSCVISCDGGKYTDKCSTKCYKKVYGKTLSRQTTGYEIAYADKVSDSVELREVADTYTGKGYYVVNNKIYWDTTVGTVRCNSKNNCPMGRNSVITDSTWHKENNWGIKGHHYSMYTGNGIPKTASCSDSCNWTGCEGEVYLNKTEAEKDATANAKVYEELKKVCSAAASCNTTQAEFTISVDYTTQGSSNKTTIYFPYTSNDDKNTKDTIQYSDTTKTTTCTKDNKNSTILDSTGCYNCGETNSNRSYMTEWSFPGTWINNKTGRITYDPDTGSTQGWRNIKEKFCLPLNVKNVNAKWYNYYQSIINGDNTDYSYNNSEYIDNITCPNGTKLTNICQYKNTTFTNEDAMDIDYNIHAATRKFGMFEWDINMSCFYAVNDLFPKVNETDQCKTTCISTEKTTERKSIRSVDLENLFPADDGDSSRTPGFNWTEYATQTEKDENYQSTPSTYTKWVQAKGYSVYSDEYLDYEVNLTKDAINQIKKEFNSGMNKKYTNWEGNTEVDSVTNYQSPLFRNGGILSNNSKYPSGQALKCNNMKNYSSNECQDFSEEVK